jgi:hypothetical protein
MAELAGSDNTSCNKSASCRYYSNIKLSKMNIKNLNSLQTFKFPSPFFFFILG